MRKISKILVLVLAVITAFGFTACNEGKIDVKASVLETTDTLVVIKVDEAEENQTLLDIMTALQSNKKLSFATETGEYGEFVTTVNGITANKQKNEYWAFYSNDTTNASTEYGSYDYKGEKLGLNNLGISTMPVITGGIYVITLSSF